jgi:hypothetical protein
MRCDYCQQEMLSTEEALVLGETVMCERCQLVAEQRYEHEHAALTERLLDLQRAAGIAHATTEDF